MGNVDYALAAVQDLGGGSCAVIDDWWWGSRDNARCVLSLYRPIVHGQSGIVMRLERRSDSIRFTRLRDGRVKYLPFGAFRSAKEWVLGIEHCVFTRSGWLKP